MKLTIWDILTGVTLLAILCLLVGFGYLLLNPMNPAAPAVVEPIATAIVLPTSTITNTPRPATATPEVPTATATRRPTWTPIPTQTIVRLPTFTKVPVINNSTNGGGCTITLQDPVDGSFELAGTDFEAHWVLKNTSGKSWDASNVDLRMVSGDDGIVKTATTQDLPYTVSAGASLDLKIEMHAPSTKGDYSSYWGLYEGSTTLCRFFLKFRVN